MPKNYIVYYTTIYELTINKLFGMNKSSIHYKFWVVSPRGCNWWCINVRISMEISRKFKNYEIYYNKLKEQKVARRMVERRNTFRNSSGDLSRTFPWMLSVIPSWNSTSFFSSFCIVLKKKLCPPEFSFEFINGFSWRFDGVYFWIFKEFLPRFHSGIFQDILSECLLGFLIHTCSFY